MHSPLIEGRPQSARQRDSCDRRTAHELRPPLSHIEGFVTSSRRTDVHWDDDTRSEFIAQIDLEANRFAELVESLCTPWSAAERGLAPRSAGWPRGAQRSVGSLRARRKWCSLSQLQWFSARSIEFAVYSKTVRGG